MKTIGIPSMAYRHKRGDVIEVWKHLNGVYKLEEPIVKLAGGPGPVTRGKLKMVKQTATSAVRRNYFTCRVTDTWNKLPDEVKESKTINAFKNSLDRHWKDEKFKTPYGAFAYYTVFE